MNLKNFVNIGGELKTNHRIYSYVNDAEYITMNDMLADGFFNDVFAQLKVDDKIMVFDSAQCEILTVVSTTNGIVKTEKLNVSGGGSGGITEVVHDDTLSGDGTDNAPLKVVGGGGSGTDNNGLEGDYATTYGIVDETTSGLPYIKAVGSRIVVIPAQLQVDMPGVSGLTTNTADIEYEVQSTNNPQLFLLDIPINGSRIIESTDVFFQVEEPEDGTTGYAAWWNGTTWQFKSNDTGNVWRPANAVRIAKTVFTGTSLTRLCFTGCRVLNKQEWLPLSGGTLTGNVTFKSILGTGGFIGAGDIAGSMNIKPALGPRYVFRDSFYCESVGSNLGGSYYKFGTAYIQKLNNGADIAVPTTGGTMARLEDLTSIESNIDSLYEELGEKLNTIVASTTYATKAEVSTITTPPTTPGTYVLKAVVAEDGTMTTEWVAE